MRLQLQLPLYLHIYYNDYAISVPYLDDDIVTDNPYHLIHKED